jgi:predicted DNA-binding transcriptional regulator YafY
MTLHVIVNVVIWRKIEGGKMNRKNGEEKVHFRRMLLIDDLIRSGSYLNAKELADKAEVTTRTIMRDIDELKLFYNAPIEYDPKKRGYYYSEPNFFIKSVLLTEGEFFSIALFDQLLVQYKNTPLEENLRNIFRKITDALPQKITVDSSMLSSQVSFIPDQMGNIDIDVFEQVFSALRKNKTIFFEYRSLERKTWEKRIVDPYHAICQKGNWYILGYCHDRKVPRLFNLARIRKTTISKQTYSIPADFNPHEYFDKHMGVWASSAYSKKASKVEFIVSAEIGTFALDHKWHEEQKIKENKDGSVLVSFSTTQLPEVLRWVLGQGHTVKVLKPPALVEMVKSEAKKILKIY